MRRHCAQRFALVSFDGLGRIELAEILVGIDGDEDVCHIGLVRKRPNKIKLPPLEPLLSNTKEETSYIDDIFFVSDANVVQEIGLVEIHESAVVVHIFVLVFLAWKHIVMRRRDRLQRAQHVTMDREGLRENGWTELDLPFRECRMAQWSSSPR